MELPPLLEGRLIRRYKRFLADVELADGTVITAHTPNTGSMMGLTRPGSRVWLRDSRNPKRKYPLSWILVETRPGVLVGIDTGMANHLVRETVESGSIPALQGYQRIRREVRYGNERSRVDLLLESDTRPRCYVEVKNVTLVENDHAFFPDAVTERGRKHLRELAGRVAAGERGVIFFCIQRHDAKRLRPADHIDPAYGKMLREAVALGVEAIAWRATVTVKAIRLDTPLPVSL